jgi:hypothetical protein
VDEVHVETFYFPRPVASTPKIYHPLCAVGGHPTSINLIMTEGPFKFPLTVFVPSIASSWWSPEAAILPSKNGILAARGDAPQIDLDRG